jgi:hypothetical protein
VTIRVGCHFGPVVLQDKDHLRLVGAHGKSHDEPGQGRADHPDFRHGAAAVAGVAGVHAHVDIANVRGRSEEIELYEVSGSRRIATNMLPSIALGRACRQAREALCVSPTWAASSCSRMRRRL